MTDNRMVTINRHEASYEGLALKFEAGEDALEAIAQSRHTPTKIIPKKRPITQRDLDLCPGIRDIRASAQYWLMRSKTASGKAAYIAKQAYKEDSQLQYILRDSFIPPIEGHTTPQYTHRETEYPSTEFIDAEGNVHYEGFSLMNKKLCAALLHN